MNLISGRMPHKVKRDVSKNSHRLVKRSKKSVEKAKTIAWIVRARTTQGLRTTVRRKKGKGSVSVEIQGSRRRP